MAKTGSHQLCISSFLCGENKLEYKSQLLALHSFFLCFSLVHVCAATVTQSLLYANVDFSVYVIKEILTFVCIDGSSKLFTSPKGYGFYLVDQIPAYFSFPLYGDTQLC